MQYNVYRFIVAFFCIALISPEAFSQKKSVETDKSIATFDKQFSKLEKILRKEKKTEELLVTTQSQIDSLRDDVTKYRKSLEPQINDLKSQLKRLGPEPAKEAQPETETVAKLRKQLASDLSVYDANDKKASLLLGKMEQLKRDVQDLRLKIFTREIFRQSESPLRLTTWKEVLFDSELGFKRLSRVIFPYKETGVPYWLLFLLLLATSSIWFALYRVSLNFVLNFRTVPPNEDDLRFFQRASSAILVSIARALPPVIAAVFLYLSLGYFGTFTEQQNEIFQVALFSVILFFTVKALSRTLLAPQNGVWRLYPLSDEAAPKVYKYIQAIVFVLALNIFWSRLNDIVNAPLSLTVTESFIASLLFAALLIAITFVRFQQDNEEGRNSSRFWPLWFKLPLLGFAFAIIVSSGFGYISLARFLASQIVISGAIVVIALLFTIAISEFTEDLQNTKTPIGQWFYDLYHLDVQRRQQFAFIIGLILHLVVIAIVAPIILFEWGFSSADIKNWLSIAFFGIKIGSINFSLSTLFIALCLFSAGLFVTRVLQKWVVHGSEKFAGLRNGVQDSVRTGVGYIGFAISLLIAISYVGVDFTNLAIVAGALSVGIGFGLQSIVNNFVSGLILLVERPVKVGDRIIVGEQEGYVRKISVRYTEVETFDRSSVIIPNSDLISNTITNWTHENSSGRLVINVGVSYSTDAKQVYDILMDIGKNHPDSLTYPAPLVVFEDFGASSLDFSLRIYIPDVKYSLKIKTELRMSILEAFREHNIEIPFPQRDLHLRSPELLRITNDGTA